MTETLEALYQKIMEQERKEGRRIMHEPGTFSLDCLLHPENCAPVYVTGNCQDCREPEACHVSCDFDAIGRENGHGTVDPARCVGCGACVELCRQGHFRENREIYPVLEKLCDRTKPVYALVAPAFAEQFGTGVLSEKLRAALKRLGFAGMLEVALFADILTLKEALEFREHVHKKGDFQLTSCCCPVWIAMIRKDYKQLLPHVPGAVSPMIAAGRMTKKLHPDAVTVFIGPCMAKKKEAREPDIADAVDYVLTFQEMQEIFDAAGIHPEELTGETKEHASRAGRIYARAGGVSEAVAGTVRQLSGADGICVQAECADGIPSCRELFEKIRTKSSDANFFEGMACKGGCVGGPKAILPKEEGMAAVNAHAGQAWYETPLLNPAVKEILHASGYRDVRDFIENSSLLVRDL